MGTERVAVLGLGRMGAAVARRLQDQGCEVDGWHRSGSAVDGVTVVPDPASAVARAGVVLLCLFDDTACAEVLDRVRPALPDGCVVVNTSTTSPAAASAFAEQVGSAYLHSPVIGSVPAVAAGALEILVGGDLATVARAGRVLDILGRPHHVGDAATAAAAKLVANGALAGAVTTIRDALDQAAALGLERALALDVLQWGPVGGLVRAKRDRLADPPAVRPADFTIAGLIKDQALLAAASTRPWRYAREIEASEAERADEDFAALATTAPYDPDVLQPLHAYARGHATGDPIHFRQAFLPSAHIEGIREGAFVSWTLDEYVGLFPGRSATDEATRTRRIDEVLVSGTVASATMTLHHGADRFTDAFLLVDTSDGWRIANKIYHRH